MNLNNLFGIHVWFCFWFLFLKACGVINREKLFWLKVQMHPGLYKHTHAHLHMYIYSDSATHLKCWNFHCFSGPTCLLCLCCFFFGYFYVNETPKSLRCVGRKDCNTDTVRISEVTTQVSDLHVIGSVQQFTDGFSREEGWNIKSKSWHRFSRGFLLENNLSFCLSYFDQFKGKT